MMGSHQLAHALVAERNALLRLSRIVEIDIQSC
jgi:hypothetical protein